MLSPDDMQLIIGYTILAILLAASLEVRLLAKTSSSSYMNVWIHMVSFGAFISVSPWVFLYSIGPLHIYLHFTAAKNELLQWLPVITIAVVLAGIFAFGVTQAACWLLRRLLQVMFIKIQEKVPLSS